MTDIATLGVRIESTGAEKAAKDLDAVSAAGKRAETSAKALTGTMKQTGVSAAQMSNAMRQLPAQFTDIATALGSGQRPMQVFLQQGGQLKDMFGGTGPAARAMGTYVAGLVTPLTVAAAALGGLGYALYSAQARMEAFAATAIRTGDFSGTADELRQLAAAVDQVAGVTSSKADDAVMAIARLGTVSKESAESATRATAAWAAASGDDIDTIAAKFGKLAEDPLRAIDALNRAEHFLTQEQRDRIRVLVEEGNQQEAARVAIDAYAASLESNANRVNASMSALGAAAKMMSDGVSEWWKNTRDGAALLADDTIERLAQVSREMGKWSYLNPFGGLLRGAQAASDRAAALRGQPQAGGGNAVDSRAAAEADAAVKALQASAASYQTAAEKIAAKKKEINDAAVAAERAGLTERAFAIRAAGGQVLEALREQAEKEAKTRSGGRRGGRSGPSDAEREAERIQRAVKAAKDLAQVEYLRITQGQEAADRYKLTQQGILGIEQDRIVAANQQVAALREQQKAAEDEARAKAKTEDQAQQILDSLLTEEEYIAESAQRRIDILQAYALLGQEQAQAAADAIVKIEQEKADKLAAIDAARTDLGLAAAQTLAGGVGEMMARMYGEQSALARAAFAVEKAIAIARVLMAAKETYAQTVKAVSAIPVIGPFIAPGVGAGMVALQLAQAASIRGIQAPSGMAHDGIDSVPKTGTWLLEKGERVTTSETSAKLDRTLSRVEAKLSNDMQSPGGRTLNLGGVTVVQSGRPDNRTPEQTAREMRKAAIKMVS